ncbi:hypothetical protein CRENBAI_024119 [Crenichthys baileyi]|uniref:Uncharacterized protein n=1 Tax=Crenichthys baileyi TaxID=28760 RepID=A0AAV9QY02_9TELE
MTLKPSENIHGLGKVFEFSNFAYCTGQQCTQNPHEDDPQAPPQPSKTPSRSSLAPEPKTPGHTNPPQRESPTGPGGQGPRRETKTGGGPHPKTPPPQTPRTQVTSGGHSNHGEAGGAGGKRPPIKMGGQADPGEGAVQDPNPANKNGTSPTPITSPCKTLYSGPGAGSPRATPPPTPGGSPSPLGQRQGDRPDPGGPAPPGPPPKPPSPKKPPSTPERRLCRKKGPQGPNHPPPKRPGRSVPPPPQRAPIPTPWPHPNEPKNSLPQGPPQRETPISNTCP